MDDLISRQAALALPRNITRNMRGEIVEETIDVAAIKGLPSAQQEQRWIPISEGPPKTRDWYLGIFEEPDTGWINPIPYICDYVGKETKATTKECWILKECTDREERIDYYFNLKCIAWMPLPECYKGE